MLRFVFFRESPVSNVPQKPPYLCNKNTRHNNNNPFVTTLSNVNLHTTFLNVKKTCNNDFILGTFKNDWIT